MHIKYWIILDLRFMYETDFWFCERLDMSRKEEDHDLYTDREEAEAKAIRLRKKHQHGEFVIFEAVAEVSDSPTVHGAFHVNPITKGEI